MKIMICSRNSSKLGVDRVRILLFRECEWRGRKLLFDSKVAEQSRRCHVENHENNNGGCPSANCRNVFRVSNGKSFSQQNNINESSTDNFACEVRNFELSGS